MNLNLETERLVIRPVRLEDKVNIFEYRSDSETNKYQGWIPKTIEDVEFFINRTAKQINMPETWFQFVLTKKENQKLIGDLGVHFWDKQNMQIEIGCTLNKNFHYNGYATEAVRKIIDFLFIELHKHRIITSIDPDNERSIRLVERIGFRKEAHFIESLFVNGKWVDDLAYALTKKNWESK
ncbi:MAG: GNAT family N-acetyltransferase [Tannerella sp.]|jgi:RimJ/RimL family protein N-acetyltransferase|nr:GNAT family N-acetyltransferase [Tannerella sp.]